MTEKSQKVWLPVYHQRPRYYLVKAKFFVPFFQNSTLGANSIDFSGVRDDKCHKSIDNGQVQSSFYDYAVHLNIARGTTKAWVDTITGYLIGCKFGQDVAPLSLVGILFPW